MEYKVFHGVVAEVAEIVSDTKLSVIAIASDESIDSKLPFEVDLMATPAGIGTTNWTLVQFDNRMTIGTDEHDQPGLRGSVYIEHSHYGDLYNTYIKHGDSGVWPPPGIPLGACTSIVYSQATSNGALAGQRYHGFEVEIVNKPPSSAWFVVKFVRAGQELDVDFGNGNILDTPPWNAHLGWPYLNASSAVGSAGLLFVNSTYAENTLHLGDPKLPIGLDGKGPDDPPVPPDPGPPQPPGPPSPPPPARKKMQRISISLANPDKILEQVLDKIDGEARVVGAFSEDKERPTVCSVVDRRRKAGLPVAIDLIAHASQGILQFGSWKIHGDDQTCITLREEWRQRTPSEIRLLGCSTASVPAGRAAMKYLKNVFGQVQSNIRVYGTTNALLAMDFGPEGFLSTELLVEVDDPPTPPLSQAEVVARWFGRFPKLSGSRNSLRTSLAKEMRNDAITRSIGPVIEHDESADMAVGKGGLESLFDQLGDNLYSAPGLLAVPDVERLYPVKSGNGTPRFHRVSSFLGGAFVRVYTEDLPDGVLLRRGDATF